VSKPREDNRVLEKVLLFISFGVLGSWGCVHLYKFTKNPAHGTVGRESGLTSKMQAGSPVIKHFLLTFVMLLVIKQTIDEKFKLDH
jgi:hypothetical protein